MGLGRFKNPAASSPFSNVCKQLSVSWQKINYVGVASVCPFSAPFRDCPQKFTRNFVRVYQQSTASHGV